jgi:hypothetical protein
VRLLHLAFFALLVLSSALVAAPPARDASPSVSARGARVAEAQTVGVMLPQRSAREHQIPWKRGMTVEAAIAHAAGDPSFSWKEAWRRRETFWTRIFRDPHSFMARIFAGEKASGFEHFRRSEAGKRRAQVRPGDRIFVDLEPIA